MALGAIAGLLFGNAERRRNKPFREERLSILEDNKRRRDALERLPGLLAPDPLMTPVDRNDQVIPLPPEMANDPTRPVNQRRELFSVLSDVAPNALVSSILGSEFGAPAKPSRFAEQMAAFRANPEEFAAFQNASRPASEDNGLGDVLDMLKIQLTRDQIKDARREREAEDTAAQIAEQQQKDALQDLAGTLTSLDKSLSQAEKAVIATPGGVLTDERKGLSALLGLVAKATGFEDSANQFNAEVEALDNIDKESAVLVSNLLEQANASGITVTRSLQNLMEQRSPNGDISPGTSRAMIKSLAQQVIRQADREGVELKNRKALDGILSGSKAMEFFSVEEAEAAHRAGLIKKGDKIFVNGREGGFE